MSDAVVIAITGIVVSGVVGPSLAAWWSRGLAQSHDRRERESADLKELRSLIDEAMDHLDALDAAYNAFSAAWYTQENAPTRDHRGAMQEAYASLEGSALALYKVQSRLEARLGPDHPLSRGFQALCEKAWQLVRTPGGVATSSEQFSKEAQQAVRELNRNELALFMAERRDWVLVSLPLAGLRLPPPNRGDARAAPGRRQAASSDG
ncbi:MAG: hypothetical protein ACXVFO_02735 [Solirubrobacteraceae bacterium]